MSRLRGGVVVLALPLTLLAGCAAPLPTHAWAGPEEAMEVLRQRAASVRTLQSSARVVLTRADGETVHLDAALVARFPDRLRLRAWKLGRAVFDLTYAPEGLWLATGPEMGAGTEGLDASTAGFARAWSLFSADFFSPAMATIPRDDGGPTRPTFTVERRPDPGRPGEATAVGRGGLIVCEVDRATLTPRRYTALDGAGSPRSTLVLDGYRDFDGILWPTRIHADSEGGSVVVWLDSARFNEELPAGAFVPPAGAVKRP